MPVLAEVVFTVESGLLILALMILIGPLLAERVRVPGLIGLIFLGMFFGPFVLEWLRPAGMVASVGAIGLLYLMFMAGMDLDINTFVEDRRAAITFGLLTFAIPFSISFIVGYRLLDYTLAASALVGAMWASHTLVAYPEIKSAGLEANRAVGLAVSATIITDVLALLVLGFAVSSGSDVEGAAGEEPLLPLWLGIMILGWATLWLLPRITRWFFARVGRTRNQRFVFVLAGMSAGAVLALVGGIEGLVGAFLAGIGINRLVPAHGPLMEKIEFFGSSLFVPAFLISVGLSIDPRAVAQWSTIRLALIFTVIVLVGKVLAALISGFIFKLSAPEIGVMAALTLGQAAATLAIAQVGVSSGIFDQQILNAAVVTVVITVFITSFTIRRFARSLQTPSEERGRLGTEVLLHVATDVPSAGSVELGVAVALADDGLLTPFVICDDAACDGLRDNLVEAVRIAVEQGHDSEGVVRMADSVVSGTLHLAAERSATMVILPWAGPRFPGNLLFPDEIDQIGRSSTMPVMAARVLDSGWSRVVAMTGNSRGSAVRRDDIMLVLDVARRAAAHRQVEIEVFTAESWIIDNPDDYTSVRVHDRQSPRPLAAVKDGDLVVAPPHLIEDTLPLGVRRMAKVFDNASLVVVGGPKRLHVSSVLQEEGLAGLVGWSKRDRAGTPAH